MFSLQLFPTADPAGTLLQVPEQISAHLPQPAGHTPAQPTQVCPPAPAEPAKTAQVSRSALERSAFWVDEESRD